MKLQVHQSNRKNEQRKKTKASEIIEIQTEPLPTSKCLAILKAVDLLIPKPRN